MRHEAIYNLYPQVVSVDDTAGAFDAAGNAVAVDESLVEAEVARLIAEQPAKEARRERNRLLTESDWVTIRATDTGDPVPSDWQTYLGLARGQAASRVGPAQAFIDPTDPGLDAP